jgi:predicted DNA-binding transcriptional regulator YafY
LLARTEEDQMRIYALDRMTSLSMTEERFMMPENFSAQQYFAEYYGVLTDDTPLTHLVVRAHQWMPDYLRTLPLHHSQRELSSGDGYTDFSFEVRPTSDFMGELLKFGNGIEILEPVNIRERMRQKIAETLKRY